MPVLLLFFQVVELSHSEVVKQLQLGSYVAPIVVQANRFMGHKVSNYHLNHQTAHSAADGGEVAPT